MPWSVLNIDVIAQAFPISVCWRTKIYLNWLNSFRPLSCMLNLAGRWPDLWGVICLAHSQGKHFLWWNKSIHICNKPDCFPSMICVKHWKSSKAPDYRMLGTPTQIETSHTLILQHRPACCNQTVLPVSFFYSMSEDLHLSHPTQTPQVSCYPPMPQIL